MVALHVALWRAVGKHLAEERRRRQWSRRQVELRGGPNYATVESHERGIIRTTAALHAHLSAFGWRLDVLLRQVLSETPATMAPELNAIVTAYEASTPDGRALLQDVARLVPRAVPPSAPQARRGEIRPIARRPSIAGTPGRAQSPGKT